jgi:hypothetical protein
MQIWLLLVALTHALELPHSLDLVKQAKAQYRLETLTEVELKLSCKGNARHLQLEVLIRQVVLGLTGH